MRPGRPRSRGYLLVLVAVSVCMLTISYLRLAATSARSDDEATAEAARLAAYYSAESGLVVAELRLRDLVAPPPAGNWLSDSFAVSGNRFKVEVLPGADPAKGFTLRSVGNAPGEGNRRYSSSIEAEVAPGLGKTWTLRSRRRT